MHFILNTETSIKIFKEYIAKKCQDAEFEKFIDRMRFVSTLIIYNDI